MKYIEAIGNRLGDLLKAANCSQSQFAQDSKISRTTINRTIKGRVNIITFETLIVFCL